jgi:hypothetical protein
MPQLEGLSDASKRAARRQRALCAAAESTTNLIYEWDLGERMDWFGQVDELLGYEPNRFPRTMDA